MYSIFVAGLNLDALSKSWFRLDTLNMLERDHLHCLKKWKVMEVVTISLQL